MAIKKNRLTLDDDNGNVQIFYDIKWIKYKNGIFDIMTKNKHIKFNNNNPTLFVELLLDNNLVN